MILVDFSRFANWVRFATTKKTPLPARRGARRLCGGRGGGCGGMKDSEEKIHNLPEKREFRRELRKRLTPAEASLWKALQGSKFKGRKFRRQHSVGPFILDFFCVPERLAVEHYGNVHFNERQAVYDRERTAYLNTHGIKVLRFENLLVFQELEPCCT